MYRKDTGMDIDIGDLILEKLITAANESDCEKRKFGACAVRDRYILGYSSNKRLPFHAFLCTNGCIRKKIDSGTDSMIGACGHAEEKILWEIGDEAYDCEIYVIQVDFGGNIIPKNDRNFYCA